MTSLVSAIPSADGARRRQGAARVLDRLDGAVAGLSPAQAEAARRLCVAPQVVLGPGPWQPPADGAASRHWLGLLVLDGLLTRTVEIDGLRAQELLGPGDVLRPWDDESTEVSVPAHVAWKVLERSTVAVLDGQFAAAAARWPSVVSALVSAGVRRSHSRTLLLAVARARRAETRLLLLFWHLADRWGRVGPDGVVVPLQLTHGRLAELVCLRRPTVSSALARLRADGRLVRSDDGTWLLTDDHGRPEEAHAA